MERGEIKPAELKNLAAELIRQLREEGAEIRVPRARPRADEERRARDEAAMRKDVADRKARMVKAVLDHVLPDPVHQLVMREDIMVLTPSAEAGLRWWRAIRPRGLILRGGVGVGKTIAAGLVVREAVEGGKRSVSWHRPNDFVSAVLHQYDPGAPELGRDLVVIDDMGRETKADFPEALCTFFDLHAARVLITTNDTDLTTRTRYDVRVTDRLGEQCMSIAIQGQSMRRGAP